MMLLLLSGRAIVISPELMHYHQLLLLLGAALALTQNVLPGMATHREDLAQFLSVVIVSCYSELCSNLDELEQAGQAPLAA